MYALEILTAVVLVLTLIFLGYQVTLQRRQTANQVLVQGHELYFLLAQEYITLIRECDQYPVLNSVWLTLDKERERQLDDAQASAKWGAWTAMTLDEKRCYRYVRAAIEIFEQTFQLHQNRAERRAAVDPTTPPDPRTRRTGSNPLAPTAEGDTWRRRPRRRGL